MITPTLTLPRQGGGDFKVMGGRFWNESLGFPPLLKGGLRGDFKARSNNDLHLREVQPDLGYG